MSRAGAGLVAALVFVAGAAVVAAALFFPVVALAGPHGDLLPRPLGTAVIVGAWMLILWLPLRFARRTFRRLEPHRPTHLSEKGDER